jgi:hypothetical protein
MIVSDPKEITPQIAQTNGQRRDGSITNRFHHDWMRLLDVVKRVRLVLASCHLDGGGALSGGSKRSKAIEEPPANAFPNMRLSPPIRLAATM